MQHKGSLVVACGLLVEACGIQFPNQGSNLGPLHQEYGVLATGPPGKSILFLPLDFPFCFFCPAFPFFIPLFFVCFAVSSFFSSFVWVFSFFFFPPSVFSPSPAPPPSLHCQQTVVIAPMASWPVLASPGTPLLKGPVLAL